MYKTDLEILNSHINFSQDGLIPRQSALEAMRQYAEQEVKKFREIAAEKAKIKHSDDSVIDGHGHSCEFGTYTIDRESITGIKIELT